MGEKTSISWCDHTWNPWIGCTKVSPACDGCYAENLMDTRLGRANWGGPGKGVGTRSRTGKSTWRAPFLWNRRAVAAGTRPFVFCASLADIFDRRVPTEWRQDAFDVMRRTPQLVYLLLTKRPQLIVPLTEEAGGLPPNAAIGTTIEDQHRADLNVPPLLAAQARLYPLFSFVSCEPLLGRILFSGTSPDGRRQWDWLTGMSATMYPDGPDFDYGPGIGWVIGGGESDQGSHKARPTHPQWRRDLRDQASAAGTPFQWKQNGEWVSVSEVAGPGEHFHFPDGATVRRTGMAIAGRSLDGVMHDARPEVS
ncbi:DUF5131 family protein [Ancylobacter defluvii]|uniref:Protein gp37 n=1 Tax=Ancylobacter defluvii TaxID=1282440 RepID=A0A9W6K1S4_9HYPH|nr:DUF5131 family protein [Ancylobacter defluvii]MBS7588247.1 DUF5131 family protein [Ancylobacter defluvii]GLK86643.1 hypothetical protein GCM10017653_47130 [Ancylobacter defluvii]